MTMLRLASLSAALLVGACGEPLSQAELAREFSGPRDLYSIAGAPLPYIENREGSRLEILAGTLTLSALHSAPEWRTCSFYLAYRESINGQAASPNAETVTCEYSFLGSTIFFRLGAGAVKTRRFVGNWQCAPSLACSTTVEGEVLGNSGIKITDIYAIEFVFRR